MIVVSTLTISTTNMTGLRIMSLGSSLRNASQIAGRMIAGSNKERTLRCEFLCFIGCASSSLEMFHRKHFCLFSQSREARRNHDRNRGEAEHRQGQDENGEDRHFDFFRLEFFADEDRDDREKQHPIKAR